MALLSASVGKPICEALNLEPSDVFSLVITLKIDSIAQVQIGRYITDKESGAIAKVFENYQLTSKE